MGFDDLFKSLRDEFNVEVGALAEFKKKLEHGSSYRVALEELRDVMQTLSRDAATGWKRHHSDFLIFDAWFPRLMGIITFFAGVMSLLGCDLLAMCR